MVVLGLSCLCWMALAGLSVPSPGIGLPWVSRIRYFHGSPFGFRVWSLGFGSFLGL